MAQDVFSEIKEIIKENGSVKDDTKTRLILLALTEIHEKVDATSVSALQIDLNKRQIEVLIKHNILLWIKANKGATATIILAVALLWKVLLPLIYYGLTLAGVPDTILSLIF